MGQWPDCQNLSTEAWRLLSYQLVHNGYVHLIGNVLMQLIFGLPLEMKHGPVVVALIYEMGVLVGALSCTLADPFSIVVGASGGVYCIFGVHLANIIVNWKEMKLGYCNHWTRLALLVWTNSFEVFTYIADPTYGMSYTAHLGGWLTGVAFGIVELHSFAVRESGRESVISENDTFCIYVQDHRFQQWCRRFAAVFFISYVVFAVVWHATHFPPKVTVRKVCSRRIRQLKHVKHVVLDAVSLL
jgi:rhomboid-related protein 1/2/3